MWELHLDIGTLLKPCILKEIMKILQQLSIEDNPQRKAQSVPQGVYFRGYGGIGRRREMLSGEAPRRI
jgi:hypothetical protein